MRETLQSRYMRLLNMGIIVMGKIFTRPTNGLHTAAQARAAVCNQESGQWPVRLFPLRIRETLGYDALLHERVCASGPPGAVIG